jgi:thiamine-phosphate pyrophosphorylase
MGSRGSIKEPRLSSLVLPRLYPIIASEHFPGPGSTARLAAFASELVAGGASWLQLRSKQGNARDFLAQARALREVAGGGVRIIINDRADLCLAADCDGVHLGQEDLSPGAARRILGDARLVGMSTHSSEQVREAGLLDVDYIAVGPIFATKSKERPDPVIGLDGLRAARALTGKPLVAIGGIALENCRAVLQAGADSVAVISALVNTPRATTEAFLRVLGYK